MSDLFQNYEDEFNDIRISIQADVDDGTKNLFASSVQDNLNKLKEILRHMDTEVNDISEPTRSQCRQKIQNYKREYHSLEKEVQRAKTAQQRESLKPASSSDQEMTADAQRRRMLNTTKGMEEQSHMIAQSRRLVAETEDTGAAILGNLSKQRETIARATETARDTNAEVARARRLLNQMFKTALQNKIIMISIIVVLVLVIFLIIYFKVIRPAMGSTSYVESTGVPVPAPVGPAPTFSPPTFSPPSRTTQPRAQTPAPTRTP
eukprot:PhF_6_TR19657/c0_g1_i2/m.28686/K08493/VTI1; vesicle transport through interaction with t-SNAREs 1